MRDVLPHRACAERGAVASDELRNSGAGGPAVSDSGGIRRSAPKAQPDGSRRVEHLPPDPVFFLSRTRPPAQRTAGPGAFVNGPVPGAGRLSEDFGRVPPATGPDP